MIFNKGEEIYDRKIKTYTHQSQFGCESTFIPEICVAMPPHSTLHIAVTSADNNIGANVDNKFPFSAGVLTIIKVSSYVRVEFHGCNSGASSGHMCLANINLNTKEMGEWIELSNNGIPPYSKSNITSMVTSEYGTINSCQYEMIGTMAILHLNITTTSEVPSNAVLLDNIPLRPTMNGMQIPLYKYGAKATYMARIGRTSDPKINQIMTYDSIPSGTTIRTENVFTATLS